MILLWNEDTDSDEGSKVSLTKSSNFESRRGSSKFRSKISNSEKVVHFPSKLSNVRSFGSINAGNTSPAFKSLQRLALTTLLNYIKYSLIAWSISFVFGRNWTSRPPGSSSEFPRTFPGFTFWRPRRGILTILFSTQLNLKSELLPMRVNISIVGKKNTPQLRKKRLLFFGQLTNLIRT